MDNHLRAANQLRPVLLQIGRALRREAHAYGITAGQTSLLASIGRHPGLGVRELAAREGVSAPAMTRYLDRLEAGGLLVRERASDDARRLSVRLTDEGLRALRSISSRRTAWLVERLGKLEPEELNAVEQAIEPLRRLVDEP